MAIINKIKDFNQNLFCNEEISSEPSQIDEKSCISFEIDIQDNDYQQ